MGIRSKKHSSRLVYFFADTPNKLGLSSIELTRDSRTRNLHLIDEDRADPLRAASVNVVADRNDSSV
jgi:hypothetical protein